MFDWKKSLGAAVLGLAAAQAGAATVTASASPNPATPGQAVNVSVQVLSVNDLFTYQFSLSFDPRILQATSASLGDIFFGVGSTAGAPGYIDNAAGTVSFFYNTLVGAVGGVSGNGNLGSVSFQAVGSGSSTLGFSDVMLLDSAGNDIAFTTGITRVDVSAVPEPATYAMLGVGLIGVAALRRRQVAAARG